MSCCPTTPKATAVNFPINASANQRSLKASQKPGQPNHNKIKLIPLTLLRQISRCVIVYCLKTIFLITGTVCDKSGNSSGHLLRHGDGITPGSSQVFSCSGDSVITGQRVRVCQEDGTWSSPVPTCKGNCWFSWQVIEGRLSKSVDAGCVFC